MRGRHCIDLTGRRYGRLTVLSRAPNKSYTANSIWYCRCDCGTEVQVVSCKLASGATKSCGCIRRYNLARWKTTHGMSKSREFHAWCSLRKRCQNPNDTAYRLYGGRGIQVCAAWSNSFEAFYRDMGPAPSQKHSIDRIDSNGHYEPGNCRWADTFQQANNTRQNRYVTFEGATHTVAQWERLKGFPAGRVKWRLLNDWPIERALTEPPNR